MPINVIRRHVENRKLMKEEALKTGASLFSRSSYLIENDPLEEIFALNLGEFLTEHLISDELVEKISNKAVDRTIALKNQLKELISIYSINNTLSVLGFNNKEDYIIYNSIAKTIIQMLDIDRCHIFLTKDNAKAAQFESRCAFDTFLPSTIPEILRRLLSSMPYFTTSSCKSINPFAVKWRKRLSAVMSFLTSAPTFAIFSLDKIAKISRERGSLFKRIR